jgi:DNA-nicking Smr family endonuclease
MCARGARLEARVRRSVRAAGPASVPVSSEFELADEEGTLQGQRPDLDRRLLRKLRSGSLPPTAKLDLHGVRAEDARSRLTHFLERQRAHGHRVVLVICGRGTNSPGGEGVLRAKIGTWLSAGPASLHVLGFTSARPEDGGDGAVYVLLRSGSTAEPSA